MAPVTVYQVRLWRPEDDAAMAEALLHQLYGEFIPDGSSESRSVRSAV
jgi:hypothetical protein